MNKCELGFHTLCRLDILFQLIAHIMWLTSVFQGQCVIYCCCCLFLWFTDASFHERDNFFLAGFMHRFWLLSSVFLTLYKIWCWLSLFLIRENFSLYLYMWSRNPLYIILCSLECICVCLHLSIILYLPFAHPSSVYLPIYLSSVDIGNC